MFKIIAFFILSNAVARLYVMVGILLTCRKHLHDPIISLRGEVYDHITSLAPHLSIEAPVLNQESERSCICVLGVSILPLSAILIFHIRIVPKMGYFLISFYYYRISFLQNVYLNLWIFRSSSDWCLDINNEEQL
jgi:hypothetical protein